MRGCHSSSLSSLSSLERGDLGSLSLEQLEQQLERERLGVSEQVHLGQAWHEHGLPRPGQLRCREDVEQLGQHGAS
jgi:hypothetical protein